MISNFDITNVTTDTANTIIDIKLANIMLIQNINFINVNSETQSTTDNFMITVTAIDISMGKPSAIQGIKITNSTTGFLKIIGLYNTYKSGSMLAVQNITFSDSIINYDIDLISITTVMTTSNYVIAFIGLTFQNIEFLQGGNLFKLQQITSQPISIVNSKFTNLKGSRISVESFADLSPLKTLVVISNATVSDINMLYGSFLTINTGAYVTIASSSFSNIS